MANPGRRNFFRALLRGALVAMLGGGTIALATRRSRETCINQSVCKGCTVFASCGLPRALSVKRATRKE